MTKTFSYYRRGASELSPLFPGCPLILHLVFVMPRVKKHPDKRIWVDVTPDLDKLTRAVGDSLTQAYIVKDDSDFCIIKTMKRYARDQESPGVHVAITQIAEEEIPELFETEWIGKAKAKEN